jgi:hypothetical protein
MPAGPLTKLYVNVSLLASLAVKVNDNVAPSATV